MLRRACVLGLALPAAAQNFAIAQIKGAQIATDATEPKWTGGYRSVTGYVKFEQAADDPLGDVKVTYEISGLTEGKTYGFHVHQYGDTRITYNLASMAAHFVPTCVPPAIGEDGNRVGRAHRRQPMSDHHDGAVARAHQIVQCRLHLQLALGVEGARRFVEQQHCRPTHQRARDRHALLLAAR